MPSLSAVDAAKRLALQWDAAIEIVHVIQPPAMPGSKHEIRELLHKAAAGFPAEKVKLRTVHGWPPAALLELARPERADLLVMGSHDYAGVDRLLAGSVAEASVQRALISVLAVPEGTRLTSITRVLMPWNGRSCAAHDLHWALALARSLCATLDVLHVDESGKLINQNWAQLDARLMSILGAGSDWTLHTRMGGASERVVMEANSGRYELVVMPAQRPSFAERFVLEPTIERLLSRSRIPVFTIPSGTSRPLLVRPAAHAGPQTELTARAQTPIRPAGGLVRGVLR